ncbi:unnamed protein product, partial [Polarella glacialis]
MVDLNARTVIFGLPPGPDNPTPHFPGVSSRKFDALSALIIYRESLKKENSLFAHQVIIQKDHPGPISHAVRKLDMMPGYTSVAETYAHMGWTMNPATFRMVAPEEAPIDIAKMLAQGASSRPSSSALSRCASEASGVRQSRQPQQGRSAS